MKRILQLEMPCQRSCSSLHLFLAHLRYTIERALLDAIDEQERRDEAKRRQEEENARLGYATNG